jgi:hypothetical protein
MGARLSAEDVAPAVRVDHRQLADVNNAFEEQ